jgi:hypothetical protein
MKVTVNVECTPAEARTFLGLPDLSALQAAMQERMRQTVADLTPDAVMRHWLALLPAGAAEMQKALEGFMQGATGKAGQKSGD